MILAVTVDSAYLPVPWKILMVPCWLTVARHVLGLKVCGPVPAECATLKLPFWSTTVSTVLPVWSTP